MSKRTGTIILSFIAMVFGLISAIFGVDASLATGDHATISEFVWQLIQLNPTFSLSALWGGFGIIVLSMITLIIHFITFKPLK